MSNYIYGPGGGALPTRRDEKMSREKAKFWTGIDFREPAGKAFQKMMKKHTNRKRRYRPVDADL